MRSLLSLLIVILTAMPSPAQKASPIHPPIPLLDKAGRNVLESGEPVSTMKTCAGCHDAAYIEAHSFSRGAWI